MHKKVLILTYGTRGDVQPYVALGAGLKARGFDVTLATSERFQDFVESHGLHFGFIDDELLAMLDTQTGRAMIENTRTVFHILGLMIKMAKKAGPLTRKQLDDAWQVADATRPDIILFHPKCFGGPAYAEKLGIPAVLAMVIPMLVPTSERPCVGFPSWPLGPGYRRGTFHFVNQMMAVSAGKFVNQWRKAHGMKRHKRYRVYRDAHGHTLPIWHGISPSLLSRPHDWPGEASMDGYWFLDDQRDWQPDPELQAFLDAGAAPLYIGFGSMAGKHPERLGRAVEEALEQTGLRAVVASGWGGIRLSKGNPRIHSIQQAPHDRLFPLMKAVVHHGGAGTTAAALRAGKPSLVVPFFGDQPFWGQLLYEKGLAVQPLTQRKVNATQLAQRLTELADSATLQQNCRDVAARIAAESGVESCANRLEFILNTAR